MRLRSCLSVKHTLTDGESARDEAQWLLSALPLWELHSCASCECICLKCPCIVYFDMICMNYDQNKRGGGGSQIGILIPDHKSLERRGQMRFYWDVLYTVGQIFLKDIRYCLQVLKIYLMWEKYEHPKFWDNKSRNFGTPRGKWHLDVVPMERHKVCYKEGSGASPKGCGPCKACAWGSPY
jgi:hypothetical protein